MQSLCKRELYNEDWRLRLFVHEFSFFLFYTKSIPKNAPSGEAFLMIC
jgi:hypothetical protein